MFDEARAEAGLAPVAEQSMRREVFVAEPTEAACKAFAPGLRHEFGKVYREWDPTYPENDSVNTLRKWGEDTFGSVLQTSSPSNAHELAAAEALVRYQLPGVPEAAVQHCSGGLREVGGRLDGD